MKKPTVNAGDVFTAKLADGRYTAVRVLRTRGKSSLVSTSPYLKRKPPSLSDPLLRKTMIQRRFFYKGERARVWLEGTPPKNFQLVGNIPLSKAEAKARCDVFGSKWDKSTGNEALLEWRWLHDRQAFRLEALKEQQEEKRLSARAPKPKKMMDLHAFWSIIDLLDWKNQGDDDAVLAPAIQALAARATTDIRRFEERLAFLLYRLDTSAHARNLRESSVIPGQDYISADGFLYARCAVVASGRKCYESILKNPKKMPQDTEFEALLSLASEAYESRTGDGFDYTTGCDYESFSNAAGWKQEKQKKH